MGRPFFSAAAIFVVAWMAIVPTRASGEVFVLRSGGRIEGELLNPQRTTGQPYQVRTPDGLSLLLAENSVSRVVVKSEVEREYEARLPGLANTVEAQWDMAEWCQEVGLTDERRGHLLAIISLDPDHAEARRVLGYTRYGSRWMTQNEFLESRGYKFSGGAWKLEQEILLDEQNRQREASVKGFRRDIRTALDHVLTGSRHAATSERFLNEVRDPNAGPALAEIVADSRQPRTARLRCLEILGRLPPGLATQTLVNAAMEDKDDAIRDRCLDELVRCGAYLAAPGFIRELNTRKNLKIEYNWRLNRAAYCLGRLGYKDATLELIGALVTEHQETVQQGNSGPGTPLSFGSGGPNGGMGGFGVGGRPKVKKTEVENKAVRDALATLHPGVNHQFDQDAWKKWYIAKFTTTNVNLRRDQ